MIAPQNKYQTQIALPLVLHFGCQQKRPLAADGCSRSVKRYCAFGGASSVFNLFTYIAEQCIMWGMIAKERVADKREQWTMISSVLGDLWKGQYV